MIFSKLRKFFIRNHNNSIESPTNMHKASQNRHMHYIWLFPRTLDYSNHSLHTHSLFLFPILSPLPLTSINHNQPKCDTRYLDNNLNLSWDLNPAEFLAQHPQILLSCTLLLYILLFDYIYTTCPYLPSDPCIPLQMDTHSHILY